MDKFIKVSLVGQGWSDSEMGKQQDYARLSNILADLIRSTPPLPDTPMGSRNISISICDQVDNIHFLASDEHIILKI